MKQLVINISLGIFILTGCHSPGKKTINNLKIAYTSEIKASAKYAVYAEQTKKDGMERLSVLFLAVSSAKSIYALNYKKEIERYGAMVDSIKPEFVVKTTWENLQEAIMSETNNIIKIYPQFIKEARKDNAWKAEKLFTSVLETEKKQIVLYNDAIQAIEQNWTNAFFTLYFICPTCGCIYYPDKAGAKCDICATEREKFIHKG